MKGKYLLLRMIGLVCMMAVAALTQEAKIRLAVAPFDDSVTQDGERAKLGAVTTGFFESIIGGMDRFHVRERNAVNDYISKLELVQTGIVEPDTLKIKADELAIDYLAVGTVARYGKLCEVDTRLVDVNTWSVVFSRGSHAGTLSDSVSEIASFFSKNLSHEYLAEKKKKENSNESSTVAVHNFKDYNDKARDVGYGGAFSEMMNSGLGERPSITTVEKKYTDALVNEKTLEMAGIIDNESGDGGLALKGIQYVLSGDIRVFDDVLCVNYRLSSADDGRVVFMGTNEITSNYALRSLSRIIAVAVEDALGNKTASLTVKSNPDDCEVLIDGKDSGKTPLTTTLTTGIHAVTLNRQDFETYHSTVIVRPREINEVTIKMRGSDKNKPDDTPLPQTKQEKIQILLQKKTATEKEIKEVFNRLDEITLYSNRILTGAIVQRGPVYKVLTTNGTVEIKKSEIKSMRVLK